VTRTGKDWVGVSPGVVSPNSSLLSKTQNPTVNKVCIEQIIKPESKGIYFK
jgi:hypothetical protein